MKFSSSGTSILGETKFYSHKKNLLTVANLCGCDRIARYFLLVRLKFYSRKKRLRNCRKMFNRTV